MADVEPDKWHAGCAEAERGMESDMKIRGIIRGAVISFTFGAGWAIRKRTGRPLACSAMRRERVRREGAALIR